MLRIIISGVVRLKLIGIHNFFFVEDDNIVVQKKWVTLSSIIIIAWFFFLKITQKIVIHFPAIFEREKYLFYSI